MNNQFTGWLGEHATAWGLSLSLDPSCYQRIDDVIIPNGRGGTAQLDHVIVSQFGIFVVETKNRNGWIIGTPEQRTWLQVCESGTFEFQNPLAQNEGHIQALVQLTHLPRRAFHSIIYFCGEARFPHQMPFNVRTEGVTTVVRSTNIILLWPDEVNHAWDTLCAWKRNGNHLRERHVRYVQSLQNHALENNRVIHANKILIPQRGIQIRK